MVLMVLFSLYCALLRESPECRVVEAGVCVVSRVSLALSRCRVVCLVTGIRIFASDSHESELIDEMMVVCMKTEENIS